MSTIDSDSSEFWNLYIKPTQTISETSESSEFWNLYRKNYKEYSSSEGFSSDSLNFKKKHKKHKKKSSSSKPTKPDQIISPEEPELEPGLESEPEEPNDEELNDPLVPVSVPPALSKPKAKLNPNPSTQTQPAQVQAQVNPTLPPTQTIPGNKKISDYTISEFYSSFMKNIIEIVRSLKQGKGINTLFNDKERLLHLGIGLIILSVILVPLTLN